MASGYGKGGASREKRVFKSFLNEVLSGSPKQDIDYNNYDLRQRSRLLFMTEPLAGSLINQNRNNVVGLGLYVKPRIDFKYLGISKEAADKLQGQFEREYKLWAEDKYSVDATGLNNIYGLQQLAFTSWFLSGDSFCLFKEGTPTKLRPYSLRLQLIEADRCNTPQTGNFITRLFSTRNNYAKASNGNYIYDGVEVAESGRVEAYHICNKYLQDTLTIFDKKTEWARIKLLGNNVGMPNILHVMNSERPDQYRGVPYLAKVIEPLLQIRRYRESELTAAIIQSFFTVFITKNADNDVPPYANEVRGQNTTDENNKSHADDEYEMGSGNINFLDEGEDAKFAQPTHPSSGFSSFCDTVILHISSCLGVPKEIVLMAFNSSYSASRAALQEAWKSFRMFRKWFIDGFCQPIYERWFTEALLGGRIDAPGFFNDPIIRKAWLGTEWIGQAPGMIDPTKDIKASDEACKAGFSTREAEAMKLNGSDFYANVAQLGHENELLKDATKSLSTVVEPVKESEKEEDTEDTEEIDTPEEDKHDDKSDKNDDTEENDE